MLAQTEEDKELIFWYCCKFLQALGSWSDRRPQEQFVCRRWHQPPRVGGCCIHSNLCTAGSPKNSWQPPQAMVPALPRREGLGGCSSPVPAQTPHRPRRHLENVTPTMAKGGHTQTNPPRGVYPTHPGAPPRNPTASLWSWKTGKTDCCLGPHSSFTSPPSLWKLCKTAPTLCVA